MKLFIAFLAIIICCSAQTGAYKQLTAAQIKASAPTQALIQAALKQVVTLGQAKNQFKDNKFTVTTINSVYQQVVAGGSNYKIDVNYTNTAKEKVRATFTGFYNTTSKATKISALSYKVQYPATTTPTTPTKPTTPPANATTSVNVTQLQTNQLLKSLFDFGFNTAVQNSIAAGTIPKGTYTVTKVNSISKQAVKNGAVYTFNCLAKNAAGNVVALAFVVRNQVDAYSAKVQPAAK
jgi:hypothetical protein